MASSYNELLGLGSQHSEDANLEGWWPLQDDAASSTVDDQSSNARNGTFYDGTVAENTSDHSTTGPNSYLTKCLTFNGAQECIDLGGKWVPTGAKSILVRFWGTSGAAAGTDYFLFGRSRAGTVDDVLIYWDNADTLRWIPVGGSGTALAYSTTTLDDEAWHDVAFTRNGTDQVLYLDGSSVDSDSSAGDTSADGDNDCIGGTYNDSASRAWDGRICDAVVFSRQLTSPEYLQWRLGPEPTYTSGVSFASNGAFNVGTWGLESPFSGGSNGTITYEVIAVKADGTALDTSTSSSGTLDLSGNAGNTCYLLVRASNTGGYDIGDKATRTSSYGSSNDGYYELASVTAAGGAASTAYNLLLLGVG